MSLRGSFLPAFRALHPALFVVGFVVVALQTALSVGLAFLRAVAPSVSESALTLASPYVVFAITLPLAVGLYQPVLDRTDDATETFRSAFEAVRRLFPRVLAANLIATAVATAVALAATFAVYVLATVVRYGLYVTGDPLPTNAALTVWAFPLLFLLFFTAALLVTRFADVFAAFRGETPRAAWRSSAQFARRRPLSFLGYVLVTGVLLGTAQLLQFALEGVDEVVPFLAAVAVIAVVGTVGLVLASALHVTYFDRTVALTVRDLPPVRVRWPRVAVVAVVLLAAVAGAGYVRAVDAGAGQSEMQALPDDAQAAYPVAANNTRHANHRRTVVTRNVSAGEESFRTISESAIDYDERRVSVFFYGDDPEVRVGGFQSEGTVAMPSTGAGPWRDSFGPLTRERNGWTVVAMPGYATTRPSDVAPVPERGADWPVETSNESAIVYRVDDPAAVEDASPGSYYGMHRGLTEESTLTVVVDRERGVVDRARFRFHSAASGHVHEYEMRYTEVGTATVERPEALGERSPMEWFWDALYY